MSDTVLEAVSITPETTRNGVSTVSIDWTNFDAYV